VQGAQVTYYTAVERLRTFSGSKVVLTDNAGNAFDADVQGEYSGGSYVVTRSLPGIVRRPE